MKTKTNKPATRNQSVSPFFSGGNNPGFIAVQAKLSVGKQGDPYEVEADQMAEKVVSQNPAETNSFFSPAKPTTLQRFSEAQVQEKPLAEKISPLVQTKMEDEEEPVQKQQEEEEEEQIQAQPEEEEEIMPKADTPAGIPDLETDRMITNSRGSGNSMESSVQAKMGNGFGADFSSVRIHTDSNAALASKQLGAQAFTTGNDIFFNSGKYNPETQSGKKLLAHELTHTIQQGASASSGNVNKIQRWPWDNEPEETPVLTPEQQLEADKRRFTSRNYGPITYRRSEVSGSGFEASYFPSRELLNVLVRAKLRFADTIINNGGTYSSPNYFMNQGGFLPIMNALPPSVQSRILPFFQWNEAEKQIHLARFNENITAASAIWDNTTMSFRVNETGWEDIVAYPDVNVSVTEGEAVTNTAPGIFSSLFNITDETTSDHLQVEIVKQPSAAETASVQQIIREFINTFMENYETNIGLLGGGVRTLMEWLLNADTNAIRGVRSYVGNDPGARGSNSEGFNNLMSLESDRSDNPEGDNPESEVLFGQNESALSESARTSLTAFLNRPIVLGNNEGRSVTINLTGFASAEGSSRYNRSLVEQRLNTVQNFISAHIASSNITTAITTTRTNDSDTAAEAEAANFPDFYDPSAFRRVDIRVERQGRGGQNVFAHELGHVFGLGDEYVEVGSGYNRPAGSRASHNQLAIDAGVAGGAVVGNDTRMMSTGNVVGAAHYATFANALNQLTSKSWIIVQ
ncbi:MAG: DUF4157 domain-containing protein [Prolixibacteraceae bacterium]